MSCDDEKVALMENALRADPPLIKSLQNSLIELTLLVEKAKSSVLKDYVGIAMGILFKYSAALLDVQQGSDDQVSFILNSLAYHHLCMVSSKDVTISAWIAMHLLEVAAAITCTNVTEDQISQLWHREDLAEYCVDTLIPSEGCIQRLHSGVYRNGVTECHTCWPTITVKQICNLFDMAIFDNLLQKSFSNSSDLNSATLTSTDVKVFLFTLSLWSDSASHPAALPGRLHIKVYEAWLADGYLEEHERDQLSKRVCELKVNCEKHISPVPALPSQSGIVSPPSKNDKVLVDVCTNTPCRADVSALLSTGDEDESFFSVKSDRATVSDRSYASAITSPVGLDPRQRLLCKKISGISSAQELNGDKKMSSELQQGKPTATDKLSKSGNLSVTPTTQVVFSGKMEDRSLSGLTSCQSSECSTFSQTGTSGVIPNNTLVDSMNTVSKNTLSNGLASVTKPSFGKVIDKDEATSFWKAESVGVSMFGRSQANIAASDTKNFAFSQQALRNVLPVSSVLGKPPNVPCEHFSSPISRFAGQQNSDLGECSPLDALIPVISQKPQHFDSFSFTVTAEDHDEDEDFYNNLVMELCQRKIGGSRKELDPGNTDIETLQKKITQIEEQMRKTRTKCIDVFCADPVNLFRGLMSSSNSGHYANLGKPTTEAMENTKIAPAGLKSSSEVKVQSNVAHNPLQSMERRKDQFNYYRYFLVNKAVARHPGNSDLCLGCMDDDAQDRALRILEQLANNWNTICDSDSD
ncbi:unnamed protein product [Angiostrongylus costaricensis]|uniref:Transducin/WD40 repeat-like superfamily protein n=1 Tax=Angiostrongylus costaricensis TaxID=334426 RepID=A0A0R3PMQ1_ANGCS|nr:unnamed protein product [Angiostrongylus costaricensis]